MRSLILVLLFVCSCTSVDVLVGTYDTTVTGTDTNTAPNNSSSSVGGTGSVSINANKASDGYLVTFGQPDYHCMVKATKSTAMPNVLEITPDQVCKFSNGVTATTTSGGTVTMDKETMTTVTFTVKYGYAYTLVVNFVGNGTRTFTGPRL